MPSDVVSRLSETLDELERVARLALTGPWGTVTHDEGWLVTGRGDPKFVCEVADWGPGAEETAAHIARWDPKAVLRLVGNVREIIAEHDPIHEQNWNGEPALNPCGACIRQPWPCDTLRYLASGFGLTEEPSDG